MKSQNKEEESKPHPPQEKPEDKPNTNPPFNLVKDSKDSNMYLQLDPA